MKGILPFGPIVRDFISNIWHLRSIFLIILLIICISGIEFHIAENRNAFRENSSQLEIRETISIAVGTVLRTRLSEYVAKTSLGKSMIVLISICGFLLLGIFLWIIQSSISGQPLKKSRWLFFPTKTDI